MSLSQKSIQHKDAVHYGNYVPPDPFPALDTAEFHDQVRYIFLATQARYRRVFRYELTMIEQHHHRKVARELAQYYATVNASEIKDTLYYGIEDIPREVIFRVRMSEGWTASQLRQLFKNMPREDAIRELHLQQQLMHHE